jgi:outer membrane protein
MSDFVRMTHSRIVRRGALTVAATLLAGSAALGTAQAATTITAPAAASGAPSQGTKIGFVNTERILRESAPAKAAQAKIEAEFKGRDADLQKLAAQLRAKVEQFQKDSPVLSDSDRAARQRQLSDLDATLQRKRQEFQEDFNRRRNEEFSSIVAKANAAIKKIAEQQNYDLIIQDAVTVNPRVDITDQVIKALN